MHRYQLFCHNQGIYLNEYGSSCQIESSPLICSAKQWTGLCIIGTSVMKDSRRSLSTHTESLFLRVVKHSLLFCLFFYLGFASRISRFTGRQVKGEAISLYPFLSLPPASQTLRHYLDYYCRESPLRILGSQNRTWDLWYMLFRTHSFYTCTGSCCC